MMFHRREFPFTRDERKKKKEEKREERTREKEGEKETYGSGI